MNGFDGTVREGYRTLARWLKDTPSELLANRKSEAEYFFRRIGITFNVYGDAEGTERIIPFDIVPRILTTTEWAKLAKGLEQRVNAINAFIGDVYGERRIVKEGLIPEELILQNPAFQPAMTRIRPAGDVYVHIAGIDIVRDGPDGFYVLEDNARTPSGVSYMLENREAMMRLFPELFNRLKIAPVDNYTDNLLRTLRSVAPKGASSEPNVVLLTPGPFNSAYYEHSFLADKMGIEIVEGTDLFVRGNVVFMRTTEGPKRVDVIYRRIDDEYLDPLAFNPQSVLGVPGLMSAYAAGNVTISNAVGTGVSDDKAIYSYMPEIVKFYLGEEPLLLNVPTWRCREPQALRYVLDHLAELVVKEVNGSGGYGMLVGPHASKEQIELFRAKLIANPDGFIAQPTLALSTVPCFVDNGLAPRHVDLRPYVLCGSDGVRVVPGGLTRVALKNGSLVVNSSQGGGTKDTWVVEGDMTEAQFRSQSQSQSMGGS
ncbi:MAG: circularly permuted type 2 ATP-grasp protein [Methylocystis sp.]|nr:circularly permuted type 2 ATP-grasp protein [Methylocystis sp.]MCA3584273.1 circularly permuted type 2 ATP-grasp protein [Methylocystis sp.]MCA3588305.1 circularly permuted type 2 ATP-grasp protein [Methylocystis sp.]MCA3590942.1 circularly permuted type 2 ATP-grasp protein [Methylocystis sp.]